LGELQPCTKGRKPVGEIIRNYYPSIIKVDLFQRARAGAAERKIHPGRVGSHVNLFAGLLRHGKDGDTFFLGTAGGRKVLINTAGGDGNATYVSFPAAVFEEAVLSELKEVDPKSILEGANGHSEVVGLEAEHRELEAAIAAIAAELDERGESPTLYARLRVKETRLKEVAEQLAQARQKAAHPLSAAWGETQALLKTYKAARKANDLDVLYRLRAGIRRVVDSVWLLIHTKGQVRLCFAQMFFKADNGSTADQYRTFRIFYRPPKANAKSKKPGRWAVLSLAQPGHAAAGLPFDMYDLRHWGVHYPDECGAEEALSSLELARKESIDDILKLYGTNVV
jgi:hypothetical protein